VRRVLDEAYGLADAALAKRRLLQLAAGLDRTHPGAAASLREGLDETLTLQSLGVTRALYRTLPTTPPTQHHTPTPHPLIPPFPPDARAWVVVHYLGPWIGCVLQEVRLVFRRLRGHRDLAALIRALERTVMDSRKEVA